MAQKRPSRESVTPPPPPSGAVKLEVKMETHLNEMCPSITTKTYTRADKIIIVLEAVHHRG